MFDLLSTMYDGEKTSGLSIAEDKNGVTYVKGLSYMTAKTEEEALNYLFEVCKQIYYLNRGFYYHSRFILFHKLNVIKLSTVILCHKISNKILNQYLYS